jgi:predicted thioesterase
MELAHLAPTAVGRSVAAEAILSTVDGMRLEFTVAVHDGAEVVARGEVERRVVDRESFMKRAYE